MKINLGLHQRVHVFSMLLVCGVFLLTLGGCAGGGGGGSSPAVVMPSAPEPPPPNRELDNLPVATETRVTGSGVAEKAAENAPKAGSVTQSSNGNGVTTDTVEVSSLTRTGNEYAFTVTKTDATGNEDWSVTQDDNRAPFAGDSSFSGLELVKKLGADTQSDDSDDGTLYVDFYTDIETTDSDWLAGGIWLYIPDSQVIADLEIGAFVDGNDPFPAGNIVGLTGTATYLGGATGIYVEDYNAIAELDNEEDYVTYFTADVELTATFGSATALGVIEGKLIDQEYPEEDFLSFASTPITADDDGGFFNGGISGTRVVDGNSISYSGNWGGTFAGNTDSDPTAHPTSVLGTFGVSGTERWDLAGQSEQAVGTYSFVGVFSADLVPPTQ